MPIEKSILQKTAQTLLQDSADCLDLAKSQQNLADKTRALSSEQPKNVEIQHELAAKPDSNANKLDVNAEKLGTVGLVSIGVLVPFDPWRMRVVPFESEVGPFSAPPMTGS